FIFFIVDFTQRRRSSKPWCFQAQRAALKKPRAELWATRDCRLQAQGGRAGRRAPLGASEERLKMFSQASAKLRPGLSERPVGALSSRPAGTTLAELHSLFR